MSLFASAYECLMEPVPEKKCEQVRQLRSNWNQGKLLREDGDSKAERVHIPGRPAKPVLVSPRGVKQRKLVTKEGRATLIHAITHIEFNAVNLALDAVYRFRQMPDAYYSDWLKVAEEEAYHFTLLKERLQELGYDYGDMPAHNGLWEMCVDTDHDVLIRMALVPRVLEARGLDVTPAMMQKLLDVGDEETEAILQIILRDEIGHVAIGSRWFKFCCQRVDKDPLRTFRQLIEEYMKGSLRGPFHTEARLQAGFTVEEMADLESMLG